MSKLTPKKKQYSTDHHSQLGLFNHVDRETLSEIDYLNSLSPEDRAWYERFLENEYNARFYKDGKDVVEQSTPEGRAANAYKQRRLYDFTNKFFKDDDLTSKGTQILVPKVPKSSTQPKKPRYLGPTIPIEPESPLTPEEILIRKEALQPFLAAFEIHSPIEVDTISATPPIEREEPT